MFENNFGFFMPPRRFKVNHHKDKGTSYAGFLERNAEVLPEHMLKKRNNQRQAEAVDSENDSSSENETKEVPAPRQVPKVETHNDSEKEEGGVVVDREEQGESRREREARLALEAKKRYEELHLAGKTVEAKADLARLAEVRRRREEAVAKAKKDAEEKEASKTKGRGSTASADYLRAAFM